MPSYKTPKIYYGNDNLHHAYVAGDDYYYGAEDKYASTTIESLLRQIEESEVHSDLELVDVRCMHCGGYGKIEVAHHAYGSSSCPEPYEIITCTVCLGNGFVSGKAEKILRTYYERR